jgi:hypothetical protein
MLTSSSPSAKGRRDDRTNDLAPDAGRLTLAAAMAVPAAVAAGGGHGGRGESR